MNKTAIAILVAFALIAVGLYVYLSNINNPVALVEVTETGTATSTDQVNQDLLAGIDLSFPEASKEVEGLVRKPAEDTKLSDEEVSETVIENGRFLFILRNFYDQDCLAETQNTIMCVIAPVDEFNEFVITTADRSQTLHRYKLTEGYSLLGFNSGMDVRSTLYLDYPYPEDNLIQFEIINYNDRIPKETIYYLFDIETGILTESHRGQAECKLTPNRKACGFIKEFRI